MHPSSCQQRIGAKSRHLSFNGYFWERYLDKLDMTRGGRVFLMHNPR